LDIDWLLWYVGGDLVKSYLQDDGEDEKCSNAGHDAAVKGEDGLTAAPGPNVQLLGAVVVIIVGGVISQVMLDARPGGARVTAAEGNAVHEVLPLHITEDTAEGQKQRSASSSWPLRVP
ncbi:hypothetical protein GOODEAATRI_033096, partial [Goodea atripinnis]